MKTIAESHIEHTVSFDSIINKPFAFKLIHSAHLEHRDRQFIQLQLETNMDTLAELLEAQWFHYDQSVVLHTAQFTADHPIILTVVLSPSVTAQLLQKEYELEHILAALFKVNSDGVTAITQQENWFLVEAKQQQDTSDILSEDEINSLHTGFKTSWYNILVKELILERELKTSYIPKDTLLSDVVHMLEQERIPYTIDESDIYVEFHNDRIKWNEIIRINEKERIVTCYAKFPEPIPTDSIDRISLLLINENYSLTNGAFELDYEDGDLRYRSTLFPFGQFDTTQLAHILGDHIEIMQQYIPAIKQYLSAN